METLQNLQAQLAEINAQIESAKMANKVFKKLQNTKLHNRTAHKYFDLQALYVQTTKANNGQV